MEVRNRATLTRRASTMRRFENAEVARLALESPPLPEARIATVIPTYCRPDLLHKAVCSALDQPISDHVVVVVDDGGGLPDLPTDPRLRAYSLSTNTGVAGVARNIGIRLTKSAYVAFLDDDNQWEREHLETALAALEGGVPDQRPALVYTAMKRLYADGRLLDILSTPFDRRLLARHSYVDTSAMVARRCSHLHFSRLIRPKGPGPAEDWELAWRISRNHTIMHVQIPTVRYLVNPGSYFTDWQMDGILSSPIG
jgi:Glycosyl transferase family 2